VLRIAPRNESDLTSGSAEMKTRKEEGRLLVTQLSVACLVTPSGNDKHLQRGKSHRYVLTNLYRYIYMYYSSEIRCS